MKCWLNRWYEDTVSALVYAQAAVRNPSALSQQKNAWTQLVISAQSAMPDFLIWPVRLATLLLDLSAVLVSGRRFHRNPLPARTRILERWRNSIGPVRDLIRFYDSVFVLAQSASRGSLPPKPLEKAEGRRQKAEDGSLLPKPLPPQSLQFVVVGSGPGGALTATLLAEAGREVVIVEEGQRWPEKGIAEFSFEEMRFKYRNAGLTPTFGPTKIAYVEGQCVGGGSEVNSGLYHRTPPEILRRWTEEFGLREADPETLVPHFEFCEETLHVSSHPGDLPKASLKLEEGARALGWDAQEVPRWFKYRKSGKGSGVKQTMSRTLLQRFEKAGGEIHDGTRVESIGRQKGGWRLNLKTSSGAAELHASRGVVLSAGTVATPTILRRSGLSEQAGRNLQMHPTVKVVALFAEVVNHAAMGVPVHQVKQFAPDYSFGCSISSSPHLRLAMLDHPGQAELVEKHWRQMAIYYAMIVPEGRGRVQPLPKMRDPLVTYSLSRKDMEMLAKALRDLCRLLLRAGAVKLFPSIRGLGPIHTENELSLLPNSLPKHSSLMSVHLFSTCPMGEQRGRAVTDSYGRVHGQERLWVADASLLPTAPGVNPQGSVMAFARRNALHLLESGL